MSINTKKSYLFLSLFFFISLSLRAQDLVPVTKIVDGDTVKIDYKGNIESVRLKFMISGKASTELTLEFMKEELTVHNLEFFDPVYGKQKHYRAFTIQDVLQSAFGNLWRKEDYTGISFKALDGYEAVSDISKMSENGGYITFTDLDTKEGWEPIGRGNDNPGPFYIVWTGKEQLMENEYPWPWQLDSINIIRFEDQ